MSRSLDTGFLDMLRSLMERVTRLETQNDSVRKNDVRLGRMVVTTDPLYNRIGIQNVKTKEQVFIGDPTDAVFSYSGPVVTGSISPAHLVPQPTVAREIVIHCRGANQGSADTNFLVHFNDGTVSVAITLHANTPLQIRGVNIPIGKNQNIYVECTNASGTPPTDVAVFVRFGTSATHKFTETDQ